MRAKGRSYTDLITATEYGENWLNKVANGRGRPSRRLRRAIARALELPEAELFNEDGFSRAAELSNDGASR